MIWNEELAASLNQVNNVVVVVLHRVEPTKVQQLALMFAEKAVAFVEANERALEQKVQSGLVNRDQWPNGKLIADTCQLCYSNHLRICTKLVKIQKNIPHIKKVVDSNNDLETISTMSWAIVCVVEHNRIDIGDRDEYSKDYIGQSNRFLPIYKK